MSSSYSEKMEKVAPKGVDKEKYERCVKEVKRKKAAKNAFAVCASSLQRAIADKSGEGYTKLKKSIVDMVFNKFKNEVFMSNEQVKKSEETKETSTAASETPATPAPEAKTETTAAPAEAPAPKLQAGLFSEFSLGSTLKQGPTGNVMSNMRKPASDYEQTYQQSTKNVKYTEEQMKELASKKS